MVFNIVVAIIAYLIGSINFSVIFSKKMAGFDVISIVQPPTDKGKRLKIFYGTQASTKPPTFVIFVNNKELFHFSYERYLVNQIRKEFGLEGTPVRIIVREKGEENNGI